MLDSEVFSNVQMQNSKGSIFGTGSQSFVWIN